MASNVFLSFPAKTDAAPGAAATLILDLLPPIGGTSQEAFACLDGGLSHDALALILYLVCLVCSIVLYYITVMCNLRWFTVVE